MINTNIKSTYIYFLILYLLFLIITFFNLSSDIFFLGADSSSYLAPAKSLINELSFKDIDGKPMHNNTPLYSIFIALFLFLNLENYNYFVQIFQIFLVIYTAYISTKFDIELSTKQKLFIFIFILINPNFFINAFFAQTEILFTFAFTSSIFFCIKFIKNTNKFSYAIISIFLMLIAVYIRPIGQYYLVLIILFLNYLFFFKKFKIKKIISMNMIILIILIVVISPWLMRNKSEFGSAFLSSNKGYYALDNLSNLIRIDNNLNHNEAYQKAITMNFELTINYGNYDQLYCFENENIRKVECIDVIFNSSMKNIYQYNKIEVFKALLFSFINTYFSGGFSNIKLIYFDDRDNNWMNSSEVNKKFDKLSNSKILYQLIFIFTILFSIFIKLLSVIGLFKLYKNEKTVFYLFMLIFIISTLLFMFVGNSRFRIPLEPIFVILSLYSIKKIIKK